MKELPIFLLNGFLDSGKTSLIKEIVENNEQYHDNSTVIVVCEDGDIDYEEDWCNKWQVHVEKVLNQDELTPEFLENLDKHYMPDRIVIEYNSFFDFDIQEMPEYMVIYQQITLIDASNFNVMFNNMKKIFQSMVQYSSLVIFNRCDGIKELGNYRRWIRGLTQQAQIAFEDSKGNLTTMLDEDLPYDLKKDTICFETDVYPTWYVDVFDNYEKYFNKTFKFKVFVRDVEKDGTFVAGHDVMTCCAQDVQFLGYEIKNDTKTKVKVGDVIYLECIVTREYSKLACEEVVMLHAKGITILPPEESKILTLS
jgi:Ni2+-binding GTPase involved in maturation of urease and hydrogenase